MAQFTVDISKYVNESSVRITWDGATTANHYSFRVYRLDPGSSDWKLVRERVDLAARFTYDDYSAPVGDVAYAVVEVTTSGSNRVEETKRPRVVHLESTYYWLIHPTDSSKNIQLRNISGDDFSDDLEFELVKLMGRGRKVDIGDDYGVQGALTGRIYDRPGKTARQSREQLQAASKEAQWYWMRNPFGDLQKIWFDPPKFSRIAGVGSSEFVDMSFNYYEVE